MTRKIIQISLFQTLAASLLAAAILNIELPAKTDFSYSEHHFYTFEQGQCSTTVTGSN